MKREYLCKWYVGNDNYMHIERFLIIAQNKDNFYIKRQRNQYKCVARFLLSSIETFELSKIGKVIYGSRRWFYYNELDFTRIKNEIKEYNKSVEKNNQKVNYNISIDLIRDAMNALNILVRSHNIIYTNNQIDLSIDNDGNVQSNLEKFVDNSIIIDVENHRFFKYE